MKTIKKLSSFKKKTISNCVAFSLLMIASSQASALDVSLCAGETTKTMPDAKAIKVWGYGIDDGTANCASVSVPGPQLTVPEGDVDLNITLRNTLAAAVSIIIPGMKATSANTPVFFEDGTFYADGETPRKRVRSLAAETAAGESTVYSFIAKAGTHMYQSGTHPAVQVQMGLYGATIQNASATEAYTGVSYDNEVVILYSEIDPAMHDAIAGTADGLTAATYGTPAGPTSTIGYKARYFLVNGAPYTSATTNISVGDAGQRTLIRFLNAGLESHAPVLQGKHMGIVAEYGHAYPFVRTQYSMLLAAGQTKDVIFAPSASGNYPLYDRRLRLTNNSQAGAGGLMSILSVAAPIVENPATANNDLNISVVEDTTIDIDVLANDINAVANSIEIAAQSANGNVIVNAENNQVTYTPNTDFNGADSFSYTVRNNDGDISNVASVTVDVTGVNDAPVATSDTYDVVLGTTTTLNVLVNDSDVDAGDVLTTSISTANNPLLGTLAANADGSFDYFAISTGTDSFTYSVSDGAESVTATVNINVLGEVNIPPVAVDDYVTVTKNTGNTNNTAIVVVSANDTDADGTLDLTSVAIGTNPLEGSVTVDVATGNITYTPRAAFTGSDAFSYTINDNAGATSNTAIVRIDVLR